VDTTTIIRIIAGCLFLFMFAGYIVYLAFLAGVLRKCSPQSQTMKPGMVWLSLVPIFNIVWVFFVVSAIANSLGNEFRLRSVPVDDPKPGKSIGIAMAVSAVCSIVPGVILVHLVLWIVYWVQIARFSRRLDVSPNQVVVS
jgi:hypothetical protein